MGNRKEYYSLQHGTVTYDPDLLDIEDIKEMDNLATNRQVDCREGYNPTRGDDIGRLQRVINHSERVRLVYDPTDPYLNSTIDPLVKPFYYLNTMAGISGWDFRYSRRKENKKQYANLIISKSGNTIETIVNSNIYINRKDKNIFITENTENYLHNLANKLKSEVVHHSNFIGGRYSVLSEVGMLPAELMGLDIKKFRQLNFLIKNRKFFNTLIS